MPPHHRNETRFKKRNLQPHPRYPGKPAHDGTLSLEESGRRHRNMASWTPGPGVSPRRGATIPRRPRCADRQMLRKRRSRRRVRIERRRGIAPCHHDGLLPFYTIHVGETDPNLPSVAQSRFRTTGPPRKKRSSPPWEDLDDFFLELRGIRMSSFEEYRQLDLLHLLANVCRHGDGPSSRRLWHRCPEFWPDRIYHPRPSRTTVTTAKAAPSSANMHL